MAGGEGTRLRPLTSNQPKPMVPIVGKPCMEHILELLKHHGFEDVIVTVAFLPQAIRSYFGSGETLGVDIGYSVEESPLGTAGSVLLAPRGIEVEVNTVGKAATWVLYDSIFFRIVIDPATKWPLYLFWAGLALALAAGVFYMRTARRELRQ